ADPAVVPSCFHFVIIPLTVDHGIFSSKEISRMDFLHRWQPIMVPCLNSRAPESNLFFHKCF
ncbi:unnamed protein product, partial [Staurois parvus]